VADPSESSQPFSTSSTASEEDWARLMRALGVHDAIVPSTWPSPTDLKVSANGSSIVTIEAGECTVGGFYYRNSTAITRSVPSNAGGSIARNDMVCVEVDQAANEATVKYVVGGSSSPVPVQNIAGKWQFRLAQVQVRSGATSALAADLVDRRVFRSPGVLLAADGAVVTSEPGMLLLTPDGLRYGPSAGGLAWLDPQPRESWSALTLAGGITNRGGDYFNCAYTKTRDGTVRLRGWYRATTSKGAGAVLGQLPAGYRPSQQQSFMTVGPTGATRVDVSFNGQLLISPAMATNDTGSLDGISFLAA
jgi:hypothetical protein